ncbi:hypothetical protein KJ785_03350 [Patescibacteria group bacterium]|nr:hypothetical protein [Patescibacteria group bacterium]
MPDPKHILPEDEKQVVPVEKTVATETTSEVSEQLKTELPTPTPEGVIESIPEKQNVPVEEENFLEESITTLKTKLRGTKVKKTTIPRVRDEVTIQVEKIMEQDLVDAFRELTPIQKQEFKIKGEQVAFEIRDLLKKTHLKAKTIFKLIFEWLKMLPGINKFFLEQEAKIKTDKILALKNRK